MASKLALVGFLLVGIIGLFVFAISVGVIGGVQNMVNDQIQADEDIPDATKTMVQERTDKHHSNMDYAFLAMFMVVAFGCIIIARSQEINPFWWWILFIIFCLLGLLTAYLSNAWDMFDGTAIIDLSKYPIMDHILTYYVLYIMVVALASLFLSRDSGVSELVP